MKGAPSDEIIWKLRDKDNRQMIDEGIYNQYMLYTAHGIDMVCFHLSGQLTIAQDWFVAIGVTEAGNIWVKYIRINHSPRNRRSSISNPPQRHVIICRYSEQATY